MRVMHSSLFNIDHSICSRVYNVSFWASGAAYK